MPFDYNSDETNVEYADFWTRLGAYLLDAVILTPISLGLNFMNFMYLKSFWGYLLIALLAILYKPYLEFKYGATLGKMATNLKVTDYNFQQIDFQRSMIRSLIFVLPSIMLLPTQYMAYQNESLMGLDSFWQFNTMVSQVYPLSGFISCFMGLLVLTDLIVLLADDLKKQRSLHDRIAKTYVIKTT